jgi:hypothetical protein
LERAQTEYRLSQVNAEQDKLDRQFSVIRFVTGVAIAALLVLVSLLSSGAHAADLQRPPVRAQPPSRCTAGTQLSFNAD